MKAFQVRTGVGLFFDAVAIAIGVVPLLYFAGLGALQLALSLQTGKWVALPLALAFSDHALLTTSTAAPALAYIPQFPWIADAAVASVLGRVHVALIPALAGLALVIIGVLRMRRRQESLRAYRQHAADRERRVQDYQRDPGDSIDGRREPFISSRRAA